MNEEIEIKVRVKNPDSAEVILKDKTRFVRCVDQIDKYFVPAHKDFFGERPVREFFRVRFQEGKDEIAYHYCHFADDGRLLRSEEFETGVSSPDVFVQILERLGMKHAVTVTKHRKYFDYGSFEIVLDRVEELGCFIEVEAKRPGPAEETLEKCYGVLNDLGLEWERCPDLGYPEMVLRK